MADPKLGMEGVLNFKAGGQNEGGTWKELEVVRDVTLNLERAEADATSRKNNGWRATIGALREASVEFDIVWDPDDEGFQALKDCFFAAGTAKIGLQVLDAESGQGLQADFTVINFTRGEPLEDVMTASVTVKPTYSDTAPTWIGDD